METKYVIVKTKHCGDTFHCKCGVVYEYESKKMVLDINRAHKIASFNNKYYSEIDSCNCFLEVQEEKIFIGPLCMHCQANNHLGRDCPWR